MSDDRDPPIRFRPTSGTTSGYVGIVLVLVLAAYLLVAEPGLRSLRLSLGFGLLATVFWVSLVRPRAEATRTTLTIRNMLRDVHIPLAAIDTVAVRHTLMVWVGDRRYTCIGIGHPLRQSKAQSRKRGAAGVEGHGRGHAGLVASRIEQLATAARYDRRPDGGAGGSAGAHDTVRHAWAWPEVVLLVTLSLGLMAALLADPA